MLPTANDTCVRSCGYRLNEYESMSAVDPSLVLTAQGEGVWRHDLKRPVLNPEETVTTVHCRAGQSDE